MRKSLIGATAIALVAGIATANAAAMTETGTISKIDTAGHSLTLSSGSPSQFWVGKDFKLSSLKVGEKVSITYDMQDGKAMASAVVPAT